MNGHVLKRLDEYIDGTLSLREKESVDAHLQNCMDCRQNLTALRQARLMLPDVPVPPVSPILADVVLQRLAENGTQERRNWFTLENRNLAWGIVAVVLVLGILSWQVLSLFSSKTRIIPMAKNLPSHSVPQQKSDKKPNITPKLYITPQQQLIVNFKRHKNSKQVYHRQLSPLLNEVSPILIARADLNSTVISRNPKTAVVVRLDNRCFKRLIEKFSDLLKDNPALESQVHRDGIFICPVILKDIISPASKSVFDYQLQWEFMKAKITVRAKTVKSLKAQATLVRNDDGIWNWSLDILQDDSSHSIGAVSVPCAITAVSSKEFNSPAYIKWLISQIKLNSLDTTAAELIVKVGKSAAIPIWHAFKNSKTSRESQTFSWIIGQLKDNNLVEPLIQELQGIYAEDAADALTAYGKLALPSLAHAVKESAIVKIRLQAVKLLSMLPDNEASNALIDALHDPVAEVRQQATFLLADRKFPVAVDNLLILCKSTDESMRINAVMALMNYQKPEHLSIFKEILLHDPSSDIRIAVAHGLVNFKDSHVPEILTDVFHESTFLMPEQKDVRDAVILSLERRGAQSVPALSDMLKDPNPDLRNLVIMILKRIPGKEADDALRDGGVINE